MPDESGLTKEQARDAYGFEVKKEYLDLHKKYAPLWAKEEQERRQLWKDFLKTFQSQEGLKEEARGGLSTPRATPDEFDSRALEEAILKRQQGSQAEDDDSWYEQLKTLAQAGIPMDLRGRLWKVFLKRNGYRDQNTYDSLVSQALSPQFQNSKKLGEPAPFIKPHHLKGNSGRLDLSSIQADQTNGHSSSDAMESDSVGVVSDWNAQIEKDLHRTFPGHPVMDRSGRRSLRRILSAYACRNPSVGYCQGMNFVAGCLLLFMDEEDAFWCLTVIVEKLLPGYFDTTMAASQVDQLVFKRLIEGQFPRLSAHLDKLGVNAISVSTQWFLCIFVNSLPLETCLRVWDIFFLEKCSSVLYRIALALIDIYAQALMATIDTIDAFILLQNMAPLSYDSSRLVDVACIAYAQVNHAHMEELRSTYEATVNARIQERLERTRSQGGRYEGRKSRTSSATASNLDNVSENEGESSRLLSGLTNGRASLSINTSKAALTAYQIASQPASAREEDLREPSDIQHRHSLSGVSTSEHDMTREDLMRHVKDILDKRKGWLADDNETSTEVQEMRIIHLKTLFARLEDEQFKADAEQFEFKVNDQLQQESEERLQASLKQLQKAIDDKQEQCEELELRRAKEANIVDSGKRRVEHIKSVLSRATAHRDLKLSLLQERQELIQSLQHEINQVDGKQGRGLLSAFKSFSLRRTSKA